MIIVFLGSEEPVIFNFELLTMDPSSGLSIISWEVVVSSGGGVGVVETSDVRS